MPAIYEKMGVRFQYPENWTLDEGVALVERNSVSVVSPGGGFWSIYRYPPGKSPKELTSDVVQAMQDVYDELEIEDSNQTIAGFDAIGHELHFFSLDKTSTSVVLSVEVSDCTLVIHYQAEDAEFGQHEPVFQAMSHSLLTESGY